MTRVALTCLLEELRHELCKRHTRLQSHAALPLRRVHHPGIDEVHKTFELLRTVPSECLRQHLVERRTWQRRQGRCEEKRAERKRERESREKGEGRREQRTENRRHVVSNEHTILFREIIYGCTTIYKRVHRCAGLHTP